MAHITNDGPDFSIQEEMKQRTQDARELFMSDPRPESTEIRIDPGGHTTTNFNKFNESPFFLPEIKNSQEMAGNKFYIKNGNVSFQREGHTPNHQNQQPWTNHVINRRSNEMPKGKIDHLPSKELLKQAGFTENDINQEVFFSRRKDGRKIKSKHKSKSKSKSKNKKSFRSPREQNRILVRQQHEKYHQQLENLYNDDGFKHTQREHKNPFINDLTNEQLANESIFSKQRDSQQIDYKNDEGGSNRPDVYLAVSQDQPQTLQPAQQKSHEQQMDELREHFK